jgi:hypothetical protein
LGPVWSGWCGRARLGMGFEARLDEARRGEVRLGFRGEARQGEAR